MQISTGTSGVVHNAFNGVLQFAMAVGKMIVFEVELVAYAGGEEVSILEVSSSTFIDALDSGTCAVGFPFPV